MQILIILIGSLLLYRLIGAVGLDPLASWIAAARAALSTMLLFTAAAHFSAARRGAIWWPWSLCSFRDLT